MLGGTLGIWLPCHVNPDVDHPRWGKAKERRIGEFFKHLTLMFNGYGDQVVSLCSGMDMRKSCCRPQQLHTG